MKPVTIRTTRDRAEYLLRALEYLHRMHGNSITTRAGLDEHAHRQCEVMLALLVADVENAIKPF